MKLRNKKIITTVSSIITLAASGVIQTNAAVDVAGGIEHALDEVTVQFKDIVAVCFAFAALVCIVVAVAKLISGLIERHRKDEPLDWKTIGFAFGAAIFCSLAASAGFFGWFGIS